jgi:hypothetical protein
MKYICGNQSGANCDHPGWMHATSYAEIVAAVAAGKAQTVLGHKALRVEYDSTRKSSAGEIVLTYWWKACNRENVVHIGDDPQFIGHVLISTEPDPPTDEELIATLSSIATAVQRLETP